MLTAGNLYPLARWVFAFPFALRAPSTNGNEEAKVGHGRYRDRDPAARRTAGEDQQLPSPRLEAIRGGAAVERGDRDRRHPDLVRADRLGAGIRPGHGR